MKIKSIIIILGQRSTIKVANWRANRDEGKIKFDNAKDAQRMSITRANRDEEKIKFDNAKDAQRKSITRANRDEEKIQFENAKDAQRKSITRANRDEEKIQFDNAKDAQRKSFARSNMSEEERAIQNAKVKENMAKLRLSRSTKLEFKAATHSEDVLKGSIKVLPLEETGDSIGQMNHVCSHCGAKKFLGEPPTTCCLNGQINLQPFPKPPAPILDLFCGSDVKSRIFKDHARNLNNAVCLSSLKVDQKRDGFSPSVIFQGKVLHLAGPLGHIAGEIPHCAQLYVLDANMELTQRFVTQNLLCHFCHQLISNI